MATATDNIPYDPHFTLWVATAREERTTGKVVGRGQRITNGEAPRMLTVAGARLTFEEKRKGPLKPGYLADLAVISGDPSAASPVELRALRVDLTMVGGRVVFERSLSLSMSKMRLSNRALRVRGSQLVTPAACRPTR
jgi:predicted amidohydrolase YtcJ